MPLNVCNYYYRNVSGSGSLFCNPANLISIYLHDIKFNTIPIVGFLSLSYNSYVNVVLYSMREVKHF